jgi:hypothetical protein
VYHYDTIESILHHTETSVGAGVSAEGRYEGVEELDDVGVELSELKSINPTINKYKIPIKQPILMNHKAVVNKL